MHSEEQLIRSRHSASYQKENLRNQLRAMASVKSDKKHEETTVHHQDESKIDKSGCFTLKEIDCSLKPSYYGLHLGNSGYFPSTTSSSQPSFAASSSNSNVLSCVRNIFGALSQHSEQLGSCRNQEVFRRQLNFIQRGPRRSLKICKSMTSRLFPAMQT
jgi:hypothetical protein